MAFKYLHQIVTHIFFEIVYFLSFNSSMKAVCDAKKQFVSSSFFVSLSTFVIKKHVFKSCNYRNLGTSRVEVVHLFHRNRVSFLSQYFVSSLD